MLARSQFRFSLGSCELIVFNDFTNSQPLNQLVTGIPEEQVMAALRKLGFPPAPALLDTNILLISMGQTRALIDTGWGAQGNLHRLLHAAGVQRTAINLVILTHTDGDHTGGLLDVEGSLAFPNAHYVMTRPAWNRWTSDKYLRQLPDERVKFVEKVTALINEKKRLPDVGAEIVPGVRFVNAPGHRQGHVAVEISSDGGNLLHVADAILHPLFIMDPSWQSPIDSDPAEAAQTRQSLLSRAANSHMLVASAHLPFPGLGHVKAQGQRWLWQPIA